MTPEELFKEITAVQNRTGGPHTLTNKEAVVVAYNYAMRKAADIARGEFGSTIDHLFENELIETDKQ